MGCVMCHVNSSKVATMFLPTLLLIFHLNNQHECIFVETWAWQCIIWACLDLNIMATLPQGSHSLQHWCTILRGQSDFERPIGLFFLQSSSRYGRHLNTYKIHFDMPLPHVDLWGFLLYIFSPGFFFFFFFFKSHYARWAFWPMSSVTCLCLSMSN